MSESFKVAVHGGGPRSEPLIRAARALAGEGVELLSVADRDPAAASRYAEEHGIAASASLEELLELPVDGIIVAVSPGRQAEATNCALRRGANVFCDTPFGCTAAEASQMLATANDAGRVLASGYDLPSQLGWASAQIRAGKLGTLQKVEARYLLESVPRGPELWGWPVHWGVLAEHAARLLAPYLQVVGGRPSAVNAASWTDRGRAVDKLDLRSEELLGLVIQMSGGVRCQLDVGWHATLDVEDRELHLRGSGGSLLLPLMVASRSSAATQPTLIRRDGQVLRGDALLSADEARIERLRRWVRASRDGERPGDPAGDLLCTVHQTLQAAYRSAVRGGMWMSVG